VNTVLQDFKCEKCGKRITRAMPAGRTLPVRIFRWCCDEKVLSTYIMCDALYGESRPLWTINSTT